MQYMHSQKSILLEEPTVCKFRKIKCTIHTYISKNYNNCKRHTGNVNTAFKDGMPFLEIDLAMYKSLKRIRLW